MTAVDKHPTAGGLMGNTLAVLLAGGRGDRLYPLTRDRSKPAVPFGGLYRIIDFTLSNCLNSGLRRICLLTQYKSVSLNRHIQLGWSMLPQPLGEFITCIPPQHRRSESWYIGTADAVYQNIYTIKNEAPGRVLILAGDHLYKMDYGFLLGHHYLHGADLTIACLEVPAEEASRFGVLRTTPEGQIHEFVEKPRDPRPYADEKGACLASMGIYVFNTDVLIEALEQDAAEAATSHDFGKDLIPKLITERRVCAYRFGEHDPGGDYWRDIGTIDAYWQAHLELMAPSVPVDLFDPAWPIRTHSAPHAPAYLMYREPGTRARTREGLFHSLVAPGCVIRGGRIANSVLSPGVEIFPDAVVEDSILLNDVTIGPGARVKRAIIDKENVIPEGESVGLDPEADRKRFSMSEAGITVVAKAALR